MRTKKDCGILTFTYVYDGSQLAEMTFYNDLFKFTYDAGGAPLTVDYNGTVYYYVTNLQGDVTEIRNANRQVVVTYRYDAWGKVLSVTGSMASTLGQRNPLRYRGYVYDQETYLYYLQSRYYDPEWGRFINADGYVSTGQGFVGNNMFAYCGNNPVMRYDAEGNRYCAATTLSKESEYDRFISCSFQKTVSLERIGKVVDITAKLDDFMEENAETLRTYADTHNPIDTLIYFVRNVTDGGTLDIKLQNDWGFDEEKTYIYNGMVLRYDDPGNINFGYVGAELFPQIALCIGAGLNQLTKPDVPHNVFSYFDDPRDTYMIKFGYGLYRGWY